MTAKVRRTSEELIADLSDLDNRFSSLVATCSSEQLTSKPNPSGGWSIAECIQHVALTNSQYLAMIRMALGQNEKRAVAANATLSTAGWFSSYFIAKVVAPQSAKRFKAPKAIRPTPVDAQEALQELLHSHEEIRQILTSNPKSDLNRIRFKNPLFPVIRFTVATGLLIMAAHGRRHLLQAERVRQAQDFAVRQA